MVPANACWYVFYTRPNTEKVIYTELMKRQYEAFLPVVKSLHRWRNRQRKIVAKVLFPGYIFVKTVEAEIYNIVQITHIVRCVKTGDRPAVVPEDDIRCIERMLTMEQDVYTNPDLTEGEHVRVARGPLAGYEGMLVKRKGKARFCIQLNDIRQCACIEISTSMLEKVR
ncbi:MAG: UpxY family transcription antiterminator [Peptococcaceae bacterium]